MKTYISFLRGINVGGRNLVKMEALTKIYISLGFEKVKTYLQSGNLVFQYKKVLSYDLEKRITEELEKRLNLTIECIIRDKEELEKDILENPYQKDNIIDTKNLYFIFLSKNPGKGTIPLLDWEQYLPDTCFLGEKIIYLSCVNGYGNTKLNNTFFEKKWKLTANTRNWQTTTTLLAIANTL